MEWLPYIVFLLIGLSAGYFAFGRNEGDQNAALLEENIRRLEADLRDAQAEKIKSQTQCEGLEKQLQKMETERNKTQESLTALKDDHAKAEAKIAAFDEAQEQARTEFKNVANEVLKKNSKEFEEQSKKTIETITTPLKENITGFNEKLVEFSAINNKMTEETNNLSKALSTNVKAQGNWGEFVLEKILESSGLEKNIQYTVQGENMDLKSVDGGRQMPDVVVNLPGERHIVIDSKISLKSFSDYQNATRKEDQASAAKAFVKSTEAHIKDLVGKNYQSAYGLNSLDFVMMFMPIEAAYILLMSEKSELLERAMDKGISIVSPSNLFPNLKTINYLWKLKDQNENAEEIARLGGTIYDKVTGFLGDMKDVNKAIGNSQKAYDEAIKKLQTGNGSVIKQAEKLKQLGSKTNRSLPDMSKP
ncbi:MAG: Chromosome partition protein Smc [Alphaproteobacteria bacterium]|nr:MAG: Chromosome partition protein Smc [Alphaproteobacteria bacterium]